MYCFFSIRSLYPTFKNVSIFKELIAIYYWMLSLFSCTTKPKEPEIFMSGYFIFFSDIFGQLFSQHILDTQNTA